MKTKYCMECKNREFMSDNASLLVCKLGHNPRFYKPKKGAPFYFTNWGWKKKCADFQIGAHVQFFSPRY